MASKARRVAAIPNAKFCTSPGSESDVGPDSDCIAGSPGDGLASDMPRAWVGLGPDRWSNIEDAEGRWRGQGSQ